MAWPLLVCKKLSYAQNPELFLQSPLLTEYQGSRPTHCHVKGNYVFDCPTVLGSSLKNDPNQPEQIGYFKQALEELAVAHSGFVKVISWEEFEALSKGESGAASADQTQV